MQPEAGIVYEYASDPQHVLPPRRTRRTWTFSDQCLARPEYLPLLVAFGEILRRRDDAGQGMNQQYVLQQQQSQQQQQAQQHAHMIYLQQQQAQKGPLVPGQQIQIQNLTVTVERFLSQGILFSIYRTLLLSLRRARRVRPRLPRPQPNTRQRDHAACPEAHDRHRRGHAQCSQEGGRLHGKHRALQVPRDAQLTCLTQRILRGHSNIVNLIDSAWNRLPDGRYEGYILMEYCSGQAILP
jgi:hypothetical protein